MGASKAREENFARWLSNNEAINDTFAPWDHAPWKDEGQFYAENNGSYCLLMGTSSWLWDPKWGLNYFDELPIARAFCERYIGQ